MPSKVSVEEKRIRDNKNNSPGEKEHDKRTWGKNNNLLEGEEVEEDKRIKEINSNLLEDEDRNGHTSPDPLSSVACGVGACKPMCLRKLASIRLYTANVFIILLLYVASYAYLLGVLRTIEKRFGFSSLKAGTIVSATDITTTCLVVFVSYLADRVHRPRILSVQMTTIALSLMFLVGGSHLYLSPSSEDRLGETSSGATENALCRANATVENVCGAYENGSREGSGSAYLLLLLGSVLIGFGGCSAFTTTFPYIDQNISKTDSAVYIGEFSILS